MTDGLTLNVLRAANTLRLPEFKNRQGELKFPNGVSDWMLSQWSNALAGEVGEAANIIKHIEVGDITLKQGRSELAKEFADIFTYLDLLALRAGIDLGKITIQKFNEVSDRCGSRVRINDDGSDIHLKPL